MADDYDYTAFDDEPAPAEPRGGPSLPGGVSLQTAATVLLVVVLVSILWIFFGPQPEPDRAPGLATATAVRATGTAALPGVAPTRPAVGATPMLAATLPVTVGAATPVSGLSAPSQLTLGAFARIAGTGTDGLRFRFGPGGDYATIRIALEGETLKVTGGPEAADGASFWRVQDTLGNVGWVSQDFLVPVAAPLNWNPPAASPTFPPPAEGTAEIDSLFDAAATPEAP